MKPYFFLQFITFILLLTSPLQAQTTVTNLTVLNHGVAGGTSELINADGLDSDVINGPTNRHYIRAEADVTFANSGDYIVVFDLLDPSNSVKATVTASFNGVTAGSDVTAQVDIPAPTTQLDALVFHRVRARARFFNGKAPPFGPYTTQATATEPTGRRYRHFHSIASTDAPLHVLGEVTGVNATGSRVIFAGASGLEAWPVNVDFTLRRYDKWGSFFVASDDVAVTIEFEVRRSDGQIVPLVAGSAFHTISVPSWQVIGGIKSPSVVPLTRQLLVDPLGQIDSIGFTYTIKARITHVDAPGVTLASAQLSSAVEKLAQFNGVVRFGAPSGVTSTVISLAASPLRVNPGSNFGWDLLVNPEGGLLTGVARTFGNATLRVQLQPSGEAHYSDPVLKLPLSGPVPDNATMGNVAFSRGPVQLGINGLKADVTVRLPAGSGYTTSLSNTLLDSSFTVNNVTLGQGLLPETSLVWTPGGQIYLHEETKPVFYGAASLTWQASQGKFDLGGPITMHSVHRFYLDELDSNPNVPGAQKVKPSNDGYWRHVDGGVGAVSISAGPGGAARVDAQNIVITASKSFFAHHPKNSVIAWTLEGSITLDDDQPVPASSTLNGVNFIPVLYAQHCQDTLEECAGAGTTFAGYSMIPGGNTLHFTPNGGLHAAGTIFGAHKLGWGRLNAGSPVVHEMQAAFTAANFFMGGHFLRENSPAAILGAGPGHISNTGVNPANLSVLDAPGTVSYTTGSGDYPGMNVRASGAADTGKQMISRLGGQPSEAYTLAANSKFYVRWSGVSGVQQAVGGVELPLPALFGFPAQIDTFGLSWLSNKNLLSRTDGQLTVVPPADINFPFNDLTFTCLGAPSTAGMAGGALNRTLTYWNAPIRIFGLDFVPANSCDPSAGCLALACSLSAQNVPVPLVGTLGLRPDGQITAPDQADNCGIDSEFVLPAVTQISGPRRSAAEPPSSYAFTPVRLAYLNTESEDNRPAGPERVGFWSLAGTVDVPFFENLQVHGHTSANPAAPTSELHLMGGYSSGINTFFNNPSFDGSHAARPAGLDIASYRNSSGHRTHAKQTWLDIFEMDYPLSWSSARRSFRGAASSNVNLFVLTAQSQVDYLDPHHANLSFGVQYEGLPRISVSNALFNAIDEETGVASSIVEAAGQQVFDHLEGGVDAFADLLSDQADRMLGEVVDQLIDPGLNEFVDVVKDTAGSAIAANQDVRLAVKAKVDEYLRPVGAAPAPVGGGGSGFASPSPPPITPLQNTLAGFVGTVSAPSGLVPAVNLKLDAIDGSLFAIAGNAGEVGNPLPGGAAGLLGRSGLDQFSPRLNASTLITSLVGDLAPQFTPNIQGVNINGYLDEASSSLDQIKTSLDQIRASVLALKGGLAANQDFLTELTSFQLQLDNLLLDVSPDSFLNSLADAVQAEIDRAFDRVEENLLTEAEAEAYVEGLREQIKARVRRELRDRLMASAVIENMRTAIRERLQVVHLAFREGVDAAFEEINAVIRKALSAQLAELDNELNNYGAKINEVIKSGRLAGHAHIEDDSLRELRLDARIELGVPQEDPFRFDGFFRFQQLNANGPGGCPDPVQGQISSANFAEITLGARNASLEWITPGMKANITGQLGFKTDVSPVIPISVGGSFEMTAGTLKFATAEVEKLRGTLKVGIAPDLSGFGENYLGLAGSVRLSGSGLEGGMFIGRSCTMDPINLINPQLGSILGEGGFAGGYVFGAGRIPIVDFGCLFNVSAGVGLGAFYSVPGPTWGGLAQLSASGEALCLINVRGSVDLIGVKRGDDFRFSGQGRITGKAGLCPFCKRFRKTVGFTYQNGDWDADY